MSNLRCTFASIIIIKNYVFAYHCTTLRVSLHRIYLWWTPLWNSAMSTQKTTVTSSVCSWSIILLNRILWGFAVTPMRTSREETCSCKPIVDSSTESSISNTFSRERQDRLYLSLGRYSSIQWPPFLWCPSLWWTFGMVAHSDVFLLLVQSIVLHTVAEFSFYTFLCWCESADGWACGNIWQRGHQNYSPASRHEFPRAYACCFALIAHCSPGFSLEVVNDNVLKGRHTEK